MDTIQTDTWIVSLPTDWVERETTDGKSLHFESADGSKAIYISTWHLGNDESRSSREVAHAISAVDQESLRDMEGYSWKTVEEEALALETTTVTVVDSFAEANAYRIVGKVLASSASTNSSPSILS
jgi:hypothetical protein